MILDLKPHDGYHTGVSSQPSEMSIERQMKTHDNNEMRAEILMEELRSNLKNFGIGATKASGMSATKANGTSAIKASMISPSNSGMLIAEGFIFLVFMSRSVTWFKRFQEPFI